MRDDKSKYANYINHLYRDISYENKKEEKKNKYTYELQVVKEVNLKGTYSDISLEENISEQNVDITLNSMKFTRIFGRVEDCDGKFVRNKQVGLYKSNIINYKTEYELIYESMTDEVGRYEFIISGKVEEAHYKVIVGDELS